MRKLAQRVLTSIAVAATTVALTAVPASAAVTSVEIDPTGTNIPFRAVNNGPVILLNDRTGAAVVCTSVVAQGTIPSGGSGLPPSNLALVTSVTISGCTVLGIPVTVTAQGLPWWVDVTDVTSGGVTPAQLSGVDVHISLPALGCEFDVNGAGSAVGSIPAEHVDRPGPGFPSQFRLLQGGNIDLENVSATCPDDIAADGDSATVTGTFDILPGLTVSAT